MCVPENIKILASNLICMLPGNIEVSDAVLERCRRLKQLGYGIAIDALVDTKDKEALIDLVDWVNIDIKEAGVKKVLAMIKILKNVNKGLIISNIADMEIYEEVAGYPPTMYTGGFYSSPIMEGETEISPIKINALALMNQINEEDFDLTTIAGTIERDPSLSISLLRFINNSGPGFSTKINSIRSAVAIMGQKEVKRWATAVLSVQLAADRPGEITRLSLIRARFAENLANTFEMGINAPSLFVAGLFSMLDIILQKPMSEAIKEIAVDEKVRHALVDGRGEYYKVLKLIFAYERANWDEVAIQLVQNNLNLDDIVNAFIEALVWYKQILNAIDDDVEVEE